MKEKKIKIIIALVLFFIALNGLSKNKAAFFDLDKTILKMSSNIYETTKKKHPR